VREEHLPGVLHIPTIGRLARTLAARLVLRQLSGLLPHFGRDLRSRPDEAAFLFSGGLFLQVMRCPDLVIGQAPGRRYSSDSVSGGTMPWVIDP
jgi:hypothetical protein